MDEPGEKVLKLKLNQEKQDGVADAIRMCLVQTHRQKKR